MAKLNTVKIVKRGDSYQLCYYNPRGERRRLSVGSDYQQAQRLAVRFNDWLLDGKDPEIEIKKAQQKETQKAVSLKEFFPLFMERHGKTRSRKTQISYETSFNNLSRCPVLANAQLSTINKALIIDYLHARIEQDRVKTATANREKAFLSCMLSCAVDWDVIESNPLIGLKSFPETKKRDVDVSSDQIVSLIDVLHNPVSRIVEFACYTGFRLENILSFKIEAIKFHDITQTAEVELVIKGGRCEVFYISKWAVEVLKKEISSRKSGYVFINPRTRTRFISIKNSFNKAVRSLGLTASDGSKLRFHDLRHVFATRMLKAGLSLDALRPLMGHRDRATTDRYITFNNADKIEYLKLMPPLRKNHEKSPGETPYAEAF